MKSEKIEQHEGEYPRLMQATSGTVVLFNKASEGAVVHTGTESAHLIGHYA